ncbi:hypothetical protein KR074_000139 [Drosophila pseudoananassae]|nr:hypothetical protein KR074_000139 [Drosophila pseudoananassae]
MFVNLQLAISIATLALLSLSNGGFGTRFSDDPDYGELVELEEQPEELPDRSTSKMLSALIGFSPTALRPTETTFAIPHQLPPMYYNDFYEDLMATKRNDVHSAGCDCKVTNKLKDLGSQHFPRYLMTAVCESRTAQDIAKCTHGSNCRPLEYKVKVLAQGTLPDHSGSGSLSRDPSEGWKFRTVTVTAGCFCAK